MYLLQTPTASPTPQAIVRHRQPQTVAASSARGNNFARYSEEIDSLLKAIKENCSVPGKHPLSSTWKRLEALYDLEENWNGYEVSAPNPDAVEHAKQWLQAMYRDVKSQGYTWLSPHVSANEDGIVVLEWVKGRKRLSVFISGTE